MTVETYLISGVLYERRCTNCGAEIHECMGFCNAEDVLQAMEGKHVWIRELCGRCQGQEFAKITEEGE